MTKSEIEERFEKLEKKVRQLAREKHSPAKECMTIEEVAAWLGCHSATVKKYVREGLLEEVFPNAEKKFLREDVENFMRGKVPQKKNRNITL